jgi:hypothetical protein
MKSRILSSVCLLALLSSFAFGMSGTRIVLVRSGDLLEFKGLFGVEIRPHFRGDGWVIASITDQTIDLLRQGEISMEVIDDDPWSEPYFLLSIRDGEYPTDIPRPFQILSRVPEGILVRGPDSEVEKLIDLGFQGVRIHEGSIPLDDRKTGRLPGTMRGLSGQESHVMAQVSDSTITEYVTRLEEFRTRFSCTDSVEAAGQWLHDKFLELGFTDVSFDSFPINSWVPCNIQRNVVAVKPGTLTPDEIIVIGGHYDSYASTYPGCDPDTLAPGADDDASGTAVVMEAARVLSNVDTEKTLIFIPFGGEEQWMWGSYHYAEWAYNQGMDIILMLNLDMVANLNDSYWDIELWGDSASIPYAQVMAEMGSNYTDLIPFVYEGLYPGDAIPFWEYGYRAVYAAEADPSPHYHRCTDTIENISIPYLTDVTRMTLATILYFSEVPDIPSGFNVFNVGDGTSLFLDWDPNGEPDLAGYHIYWGTEPGVYDSVRTVTSVGDTLGNLIEGETYYLAISAFDLDDNESFLTGEVEITTSSIPLAPTAITSLSLDTSIVIGWDRNQGDLDVYGYNIYRWEMVGGVDTVMIGSVPDPTESFVDQMAEIHILYGYHVTTVDTEVPPNESDPSDAVYGRLTTHDMGILVVDNTPDGSGGQFSPTDEEVDGFYSDILGDYNVGAMWDVRDSVGSGRYVMDYDLGLFSVVLWHDDLRGSLSTASDTAAMRRYLDGGGNLWLAGWQLLAFLTGRSESYFTFTGDNLISGYMGVDSALTTSSAVQDFVGAEGLSGGFESIEVDSGKVAPIGALYNMEILLPPFSGASPLYGYISSDSTVSIYHGLPVGVASSSAEYGFVVTDFPLYFMESEGAEMLVDAVMELFGEPVSVGEGEIAAGLPRAYSLSQNYPNPFNPMTTIGFEVPIRSSGASNVALRVYDIRGRLVRTLIDEPVEPGVYQIGWDGRDVNGIRVASGIYFYTIKTADFSATRKMTLLK